MEVIVKTSSICKYCEKTWCVICRWCDQKCCHQCSSIIKHFKNYEKETDKYDYVFLCFECRLNPMGY